MRLLLTWVESIATNINNKLDKEIYQTELKECWRMEEVFQSDGDKIVFL
jgi:hypothetical protein